MAHQKIRSVKFRPASRARISQLEEIVEEYQQQGLRLTARQLYYQCVSRDIVPNVPAEYKKLTALLTDARYAGLIDWDAIEDRGREPSTPNEWESLEERIDGALANYRLPRWKNQPHYAELWVEKQALAGVLEPLSFKHHVTLMVNKGYSSASAMKESADRIRTACGFNTEECQEKIDLFDALADDIKRTYRDNGDDGWDEDDKYVEAKETFQRWIADNTKECFIFYLGDHDPSGEDMVRDISTRLKEFGVYRLNVEKIGLTTAQVRQYNPPPNPAKITDPRAAEYIKKHGPKSWEVDALPPTVLTQLVQSAFKRVIDQAALKAVLAEEERDKELLKKAVEKLRKKA